MNVQTSLIFGYLWFKDIAAYSFKLIWLWMSKFGTFIKRLGQSCFAGSDVQAALCRSMCSVAGYTSCLAFNNIRLSLDHTLSHSGKHFGCACLLRMPWKTLCLYNQFIFRNSEFSILDNRIEVIVHKHEYFSIHSFLFSVQELWFQIL